jgi:hypothetical protein
MILALLPACSREGNPEQGGIYVRRSACPIPGIPAGTGDVTIFDPANSITADAIDVTATITNLRANCQEIEALRHQDGDMILTAGGWIRSIRHPAMYTIFGAGCNDLQRFHRSAAN